MDIMSIIEIPVAWILVTIHSGLVAIGMADGPGLAWVLSIVGLTIVIRLAIMPLFFRQIKASRGMQLLQPELRALQAKYKGKTDPVSRQAQQQEMMALYKKHDANLMASCLPLLVQMPIFFGLFNVLRGLAPLAAGEYAKGDSIGPLTRELAAAAEKSELFGAPLSGTFMTAGNYANSLTIQIVTVCLIVFMSATQFWSMRQTMTKNMPASALDNPMFKQQKMLMYAMPVIFMVTGVAFPLGVMVYWTASNLWALGQQTYTLRRHPAPGSEAHKAKMARDAERRAKKGLPPTDDDIAATTEVQPKGQRVQPMGKNRAKKKGINPSAAAKSEDGDDTSQAEAMEEDAAAELAAAEAAAEASEDAPERGKDGLTDEERARKRYEARAAERRAAREKRAAAEKRRRENEQRGRYSDDA